MKLPLSLYLSSLVKKPAMKTTAKAARYSRGELDRSMNTIGS